MAFVSLTEIPVSPPTKIERTWGNQVKDNEDYLKAQVDALAGGVSVPLGGVITWAAPLASIPAGFHLCDGAAVSRTTYAALFSLIGTAFGVGDGSTTFNLPNTVAKFVQGVATSSTNPGATGGAVSKNTVGHSHTMYSWVNNIVLTSGGLYTIPTNVGTAPAQDTISDIRPPYVEMAHIIRIS